MRKNRDRGGKKANFGDYRDRGNKIKLIFNRGHSEENKVKIKRK